MNSNEVLKAVEELEEKDRVQFFEYVKVISKDIENSKYYESVKGKTLAIMFLALRIKEGAEKNGSS